MRGLVGVLIAGLLAAGCASEDQTTAETLGSDEEETQETEPDQDETTTTEESSDEEETSTTADASSDPTATDSGFSTYPALEETWASAGAVISNPSSEDFAFVEVVFNLKAGDTPVATETAFLNLVPADTDVYAAVSVIQNLTTPPDSIEVEVVTDDEGFYDPDDYIAIPLTVSETVRDEFGLVTVTGTAMNPTDEIVEFGSVNCVLLGGGTIVGGLITSLDTMTPNAEIAWEGSDSIEGVDVDDAKCSADASLP